MECKLWRNPEARREVVGQILEYAKTLSRWTYDDLQREVSARTGKGPDALLSLVRTIHPTLDEQRFIDAVTFNLRRGRFLLLILGDGIREDVESLASYLQLHAGIHFSFGLVEFPIYKLPSGEKLVVPRVVARTTSIVREVLASPAGFIAKKTRGDTDESNSYVDPDKVALGDAQFLFWSEFLDGHLHLDDRSQPIPRAARSGHISFMLPAPEGTSWISVYRDLNKGELGLFLSASQNSMGEIAMNDVNADWGRLRHELGGTAHLWDSKKYKRQQIVDSKVVGDLKDPAVRERAGSSGLLNV